MRRVFRRRRLWYPCGTAVTAGAGCARRLGRLAVEQGAVPACGGEAMQAKEGDRTIGDWRQDIDRIDAELVALLNRRAECALAIGRIKRRERLPVRVPEREQHVLARVAALNGGPLPETAVQAI